MMPHQKLTILPPLDPWLHQALKFDRQEYTDQSPVLGEIHFLSKLLLNLGEGIYRYAILRAL